MKAKKSTSTWSAVTKDPRHKTSSGSRRDPVLTKRASDPPRPEAFLLPAKGGTGASFAGPVTSLYVHVPFCAQKCEYCAFYSEASSGELINRYVDALVAELELVAEDLNPRTIFFGGGTPSILNLRQWEKILSAMRRLKLVGAQEWTVECNPATVSADKARLLRDFGVNRVSMGVQSLNADLLRRLGRV